MAFRQGSRSLDRTERSLVSQYALGGAPPYSDGRLQTSLKAAGWIPWTRSWHSWAWSSLTALAGSRSSHRESRAHGRPSSTHRRSRGRGSQASARSRDGGLVPPAQATRLRTMGRSECWEQTHASAAWQSNMQFAAKTPIALAVIGICAIRRIFVAPTTKSGGTEKTASEANRRVPLARIRFRRCLLWYWTDASRPHWKRRASPWGGWTPLEHCRPTGVRSLVVAFARRRSSQRESRGRGYCRPSDD